MGGNVKSSKAKAKIGDVADHPAGRVLQAARAGEFERTIEHLREVREHLRLEREGLFGRTGTLGRLPVATGRVVGNMGDWLLAIDAAIDELRRRDAT
jgi:hypothetical protein